MTIDTDFHSHVARSSALQMAQAAREKGLRILGLSEHIFQMTEAQPTLQHMPQEGPLLSFAVYSDAVRSAERQAHIETRLGLEVDFIPGMNERIQSFLPGHDWDFLIGSVHAVDGIIFGQESISSREKGEERWLRYFALLREAATCGVFSLVSHPVRMRVGNAFLPSTFDDELERLTAEAARCDVALEINGYDALHYPSLVRKLARACVLHNTPISVGSDAHNPAEIAQAHQLSEEILRKTGINRIRIWSKMEPDTCQF
ncbi:MAG TPA: PHP domain-containing protein [Ktedonobacteraceae bacterium]|nr:PHP domain-containing protein [Ktedonobacteraceae bacterium]